MKKIKENEMYIVLYNRQYCTFLCTGILYGTTVITVHLYVQHCTVYCFSAMLNCIIEKALVIHHISTLPFQAPQTIL